MKSLDERVTNKMEEMSQKWNEAVDVGKDWVEINTINYLAETFGHNYEQRQKYYDIYYRGKEE